MTQISGLVPPSLQREAVYCVFIILAVLYLVIDDDLDDLLVEICNLGDDDSKGQARVNIQIVQIKSMIKSNEKRMNSLEMRRYCDF